MATVESFFKSYLSFPIIFLFWAGGYLWKREGWISVKDIDVDTGRREHDWDAIHAYRQRVAEMPAWKRLLYLCFR